MRSNPLNLIYRAFLLFDCNYSVDYLLPVQVKGQWIGVVYREMEPIMVLMDRYDITNKAMICDPSFNSQTLCGFRNCSTRLRIVADDRFEREQDAVVEVPRLMMNGSNGSNRTSTPRSLNNRCNRSMPRMMNARSHPLRLRLAEKDYKKKNLEAFVKFFSFPTKVALLFEWQPVRPLR